MSWEVLLVPAASWKIPFINNWYSSWNPRPPSSDQTVRVLDLFEYAGNYGPGGEKSMQIIIYEGCTTLPKAQNSFPLLLYNVGWKTSQRGWIHLSVIGTPVREPCHKCHKCLRILRKSDFSEHRKYSCLVGTNPFISYLEQWSGFCQKRHKWLGDALADDSDS